MSNDNSNERTQWGEYDVAELGRLMMLSSQLGSDLNDVDPLSPTDDDREALYDAKYHTHKAFRILAALAIKAQREYAEMTDTSEESE